MGVRVLYILVFCNLLSVDAFSQYTEFKYKRKNHSSEAGYLRATKETKYFNGGIGVHMLNYFGDLSANENYLKNTLKSMRPGVSAFVNYHQSSHLFFKGELMYGRIFSNDNFSDPYATTVAARKYVRNLSFRNDMVGISLISNLNLLRDPFEYFKRRNFNVYLSAGLSVLYSNPKAKVPEMSRDGIPFGNAGDWVALRPLGTEGQNHPDYGNKYSPIQLGIPFGGGVRIRLGYKMDLYLEASAVYFLSDYLDDVGSDYVDLGVLDSELARTLSDRSQETTAVIKNKLRDQNIINNSTSEYTYESKYDGQSYTVYHGFGNDGDVRGGSKSDVITITSIKFSYIFAN